MEVLAELFVILIVVMTLGEITERAGLSSSVGEIIAGIALASLAAWAGPNVPFLAQLGSGETLELVANLGIFFLVLVAGIEMEPTEFIKSSTTSFIVAAGGVALPLFGGIALAWAFLPDSELRPAQALLVGTALSITAVPAAVKVLNDFNQLHSKIGEIVISAAVFDDVLGLFLLAILLAMIETGQVPDATSIGWMLGKVAIFFGVTLALGAHVYPRVQRGIRAMQLAAIDFSALAVVSLAYGWFAELLGLHWILGAFMAGLFFERARVGVVAYNEIKLICGAVTSGILGPLFFAYIGMRVDLAAIVEIPFFLCLLLFVALGAKIIGAGLPARFMGMNGRDSLSVGFAMSARGAVGLVVLNIADEAGILALGGQQDPVTNYLYSALIIVAVITTLSAPVLLRYTLPKIDESGKK